MRRRPQPHDLWAQGDGAVVLVQGDGAVVLVTGCVVEADQNRHADIATLLNFSDASSRPPQGRHESPAPMTIQLIRQSVTTNPGRRPRVSGRQQRRAAPPASGQRTPGLCWREYNHE